MTPELQNALYRAWPEIFRQKDLDETRTAMCWGFQCGDGWWELIDAVCDVMTAHARSGAHEIFEVNTVKQKFGSLRIYVDGKCDFCQGSRRLAERYSELVCEETGRPGWRMTAKPPYRTVKTVAPDMAENQGFTDGGKGDPLAGAIAIEGIPRGWQRLAYAVIEVIQWDKPDTLLRLAEVDGILVASDLASLDPSIQGVLACSAALGARTDRITGALGGRRI
jgi:hypothetical protein